MSLFKVFDIAGSGMVAQSQRLNVVASNLANADAAAGPDGQAYRARQVVFQTALSSQRSMNGVTQAPTPPVAPGTLGALGGAYTLSSNQDGLGVRVAGVVEDPTPNRRLYDPKHPFADQTGYVTMPNVNPVEEMVNMISASRSYQTNAEMMNTAKTLLLRTLQLGQ
ncbi:MAG: flagellar basal body rod protein FlgC [Burkholderiales bacterium]